MVERDGQIGNLSQVVVERDGQIGNLSQVVVERDGQIGNLNQVVKQHYHEIAALRNSTSWWITKPLRFVSRLLNRNRKVFDLVNMGEAKKTTFPVNNDFQEMVHQRDKLPAGFDGDLYLSLNADLAKAGVDPEDHYLHHGLHEGRVFSLPTLDFCVDHEFNSTFETILVVSHEASRTGAPVLTLNIAQALVGRYNVVVLLLGGGPLSDAYRLTSMALMISLDLNRSEVNADVTVGKLCKLFDFKFAIVNSLESRKVLRPLANHFVPTISLIHEFSSCYTHPKDVLSEVCFWSSEVVFSADAIMKNALSNCPHLHDRSAHVLPQGRCHVPLDEFSAEQMQVEQERIRCLIRPKDISEETLIILGAGSVQFRKGVDLFIECATRVFRAEEGSQCRFVWIGKGYDPDNDVGYSVYLADQVRRAGLEGHVFFVDETAAIETAYEEADLFLLSSRLDPLPNVAIDAMAHEVPVVCFDKTTGIADFLIDSNLGNHCVADYLDSSDMAEKILALLSSQVLRKHIGSQCREASIAYFNMQKYITHLEVLSHVAYDHSQQEKVDTQVILDSGLFRLDFSSSLHLQDQPIEAAVRVYVRAWVSGIGRRKPFPGFHPGIYQEQHGLATQGADPFADYLRAGQPEGPWSYLVIDLRESDEKDLPRNQAIALHLHVYYPELLPEITMRLSHNRICPDLFVSVKNEHDRELVIDQLTNYKGRVVDIQIVPNRGRDIGPFLSLFGPKLFADYDFVGHIHTKMTADLTDSSIGRLWYLFLLENLLGGKSGAMADSILAEMKGDESIGMVFPDEPNIVGWSANVAIAESLALRLGLQKLPENFLFPVGTMFWARTSALAPIMSLKLDWDDYPEEPLAYDGTFLHAIERFFPLTLSINKLRIATTNVMGLTR